MLAIADAREDIRLGFAVLQAHIRPGGSLNLTDINVHAEDFVADVLNAIFSWHLINTNRARSNSPCIDLLDTPGRLGVQVTSEKGVRKINEAMKCIDTNKLSQQIDRFKVFSLISRQKTYSVSTSAAGVAFLWQQDILDFDLLLREVQNITNAIDLQAVHRVVTSALPKVFSDKRARLAQIRDNLASDISIFDREVMRAPFDQEEPDEMLSAIRETRISLQRRGVSLSANVLAAKNFARAIYILRNTEYEVKRNYPLLYEICLHGRSRSDFSSSDKPGAVQMMMNVRNAIENLLAELKGELARIDALL